MRLAEPSDFPWISSCILAMHKESPTYSKFPEDWKYVPTTVKNFIVHPDMIFVVNTPRSFMVVATDTPWFAPSVLHAYELLLYVDPEFRGGMEVVRLIKFMETMCQEHGVDSLHVGASVGLKDERTMKLYERLGYERMTAPARKDF